METYIALRYTEVVQGEITSDEYRALAELRYLIRKFVGEGDAAARAAGLEPQQYLLLLHIKGYPGRTFATVGELAHRLQAKPHGVVALVTRCEEHGFVERRTDAQCGAQPRRPGS